MNAYNGSLGSSCSSRFSKYRSIDELKNGLQADRLSASSFRANGFRLLLHVVAYALVVLFREAASAIPEVATARVSTLRQRLWKVGAVVVSSARRIWLHVSETWPGRRLWEQVHQAVTAFVGQVLEGRPSLPCVGADLPM